MQRACELSPLGDVRSPARDIPLRTDQETELTEATVSAVVPTALTGKERSFIAVHSFVNCSDSCRTRKRLTKGLS